jgi:hypothetical protein
VQNKRNQEIAYDFILIHRPHRTQRPPQRRTLQSLEGAHQRRRIRRLVRRGAQGQTFIAGQQVQGHITIPGFEHVLFDVLIERVEPETLFSYRWHPYAVDPAVDYSGEPTTLVEFTLKDTPAKARC